MNKAQKQLVYEELVQSLVLKNAELQEIKNELSCCDDVPLQGGAVAAIAHLRQQRDDYRTVMAGDMAMHLAYEMASSIKLLALVKRSAHLLAELPKELQSPEIKAHRTKLVDSIKQHDPDHYGGEG